MVGSTVGISGSVTKLELDVLVRQLQYLQHHGFGHGAETVAGHGVPSACLAWVKDLRSGMACILSNLAVVTQEVAQVLRGLRQIVRT